jgi:hypothetical protein
MLESLSLAIRIYRHLAESTQEVAPGDVWEWAAVRKALLSAPHGPGLIKHLETLGESAREGSLAWLRSMAPFAPMGRVVRLPGVAEARAFLTKVRAEGMLAEPMGETCVQVHDVDEEEIRRAVQAAQGVLVETAASAYKAFDHDLFQNMLDDGNSVERVESAILRAIESRGAGTLDESFVIVGQYAPEEKFIGRLERFADLRPRQVLGMDVELAEALYVAGRLPAAARPIVARVLHLTEETESAPVGDTAASPAQAGTPLDKGGVAKDQPDVSAGAPAQSQDGEKKEAEQPTDMRPDEPSDEITLPDGTIVPEDVLRQALARMLVVLSTQLEQGVGTNGQPNGNGEEEGEEGEEGDAEADEGEDEDAGATPAPAAPPAEKPAAQAAAQTEGTIGPSFKTGDEVRLPDGRTGRVITSVFNDVIVRLADGSEWRGPGSTVLKLAQTEAVVAEGTPMSDMLNREFPPGSVWADGAGERARITGNGSDGLVYYVEFTRLDRLFMGWSHDYRTADQMIAAKKSGEIRMVRSESVVKVTEGRKHLMAAVADPAKFEVGSFKVVAIGEGVQAQVGRLAATKRERIQSLVFDKAKFTEATAQEWITRYRAKTVAPARRPELTEAASPNLNDPLALSRGIFANAKEHYGATRSYLGGSRGMHQLQIWFPNNESARRFVAEMGGEWGPNVRIEESLMKDASVFVEWYSPMFEGQRLDEDWFTNMRESAKAFYETASKDASSAAEQLGTKPTSAKSWPDMLARAERLGDHCSVSLRQALVMNRELVQAAKGADALAGVEERTRRSVAEAEEPGDAEEKAVGAAAWEDARAQVSAMKAAVFKLVTDDLVKIEAVSKALDAKKAMRAAVKLRETFEELHDEMKKALGSFEDAHDMFVAETGAEKPAEEAPAAEAPAPAPAAPAPAAPAAEVPAPAAPAPAPAAEESRTDQAVRRLTGSNVARRVAEGVMMGEVVDAMRAECSDLGLSVRELAEVHERISGVEALAAQRVYKLSLSEADRELVSAVSQAPTDAPGRFAQATAEGREAKVYEAELEEVIGALRCLGEVEHGLLAAELSRAMRGMALTAGRV